MQIGYKYYIGHCAGKYKNISYADQTPNDEILITPIKYICKKRNDTVSQYQKLQVVKKTIKEKT